MKETAKSWLLNLLLMFGLFFFMLLIYLVYIAGPNRAYEKEDKQYMLAFEESIDKQDMTLENRFSFSTVYYIASDKAKTELYWFTRDMEISEPASYQDFEPARIWAQGESLEAYTVSYGVYEQQFIYVIHTDQAEYFIDYETQELILRIGG